MAMTGIGNWSMIARQLFPRILPSFLPDTTATADPTWRFEFFEILKSLLRVVITCSAAITKSLLRVVNTCSAAITKSLLTVVITCSAAITKSLLRVVINCSAAITGFVIGLVAAMFIGTLIPLHPRGFARFLPILFGLFHAVNAYCECGYTFQSAEGINYLTTDLIESDFIHSRNVFKDTDWRVQGYSVTAQDSRGPYGTNFTTSNVLSNPILDAINWTGPGILGGLPGMQLVVSGGIPVGQYIQTAQVNSVRTDLMYGSFRFLANLPKLKGTCSAMFDYYNNSQETDMEALSSQFFSNGTNLINLVQQTQDSAARGYSILGQDYVVANLPFDPTNGFHEYRFDVLPGQINFYLDHILIGNMSAPPPTSGRHLILSHWSNGNPLWSGGPPSQDAIMTIGYVKAYFNSSDSFRQSAALTRCPDPTIPGASCPIPDDILQGGSLFSEFFFDQPNKTNNQTVFGKKNDTSARADLSKSILSLLGLSGFVLLFL